MSFQSKPDAGHAAAQARGRRRQAAHGAIRLVPLLACALLAGVFSASAQAGRFDGEWNVEMHCPAVKSDDDDKGYTHRFKAQVVDGELHGEHKSAGEPGYHLLTGKIGDKGNAALRLDGVVNNPNYAIHNARYGSSYSYRVKAKFDERSGLGQRQSGRVCEFRFSR
jgi:hypothetical protein